MAGQTMTNIIVANRLLAAKATNNSSCQNVKMLEYSLPGARCLSSMRLREYGCGWSLYPVRLHRCEARIVSYIINTNR